MVTTWIIQLFAKAYDYFEFDDEQSVFAEATGGNAFDDELVGEYKEGADNDLDYPYSDITADPSVIEYDNTALLDDTPVAPTIASVGMCNGTSCQEGAEGTFDVNDQVGGEIIGGEGQKHVSVNFFAWAGKNQMPIKNIVVDWGDSFAFNNAGTPDWPIEIGRSQSGSTTNDNFYKNFRGYSQSNTLCDNTQWGRTTESCSNTYVSFTHDYTCSAGDVEDLEVARECEVDSETGRLVNSPCTGGEVTGASGACVYQPRVHVKDNWGWCTGECDNEDVSATQTDPSGDDGCWGSQECDVLHCPGNETCIDDDASDRFDNPWINWDGYIIVMPE